MAFSTRVYLIYNYMNKTKFLPIMIVSTMMTMAACGGNDGVAAVEDIEGVEMDSVVVDTVIPLGEDEDAPSLELYVHVKYDKAGKLPVIKDSILLGDVFHVDAMEGGDSIKTVEQAVAAVISGTISDYVKDFGEMYAADKEHPEMYNMMFVTRAITEVRKPGILNYTVMTVNHIGDITSYMIIVPYNIDIKTGKIMTLDDVFKPGYERKLTEAIVHSLYEQYDVEDFEELQETGVFVNMNAYPSENFIIDKDTMLFIYEPNEITPYGMVIAGVDYDDLKDILKK